MSGSRTATGCSSFCFIAGPVDSEDNDHHRAGDTGALASGRLSALLAVEVEEPGWPVTDLSRVAGLDPAHEPREHALGAPHIHGELLKLGLTVAQSTVAKYMARRVMTLPARAGARSFAIICRTLPAIDLFVVPTIGFRLLYALVIVRLARRELVWINVTAHPTADWMTQQITEAFRGTRHHAI